MGVTWGSSLRCCRASEGPKQGECTLVDPSLPPLIPLPPILSLSLGPTKSRALCKSAPLLVWCIALMGQDGPKAILQRFSTTAQALRPEHVRGVAMKAP